MAKTRTLETSEPGSTGATEATTVAEKKNRVFRVISGRGSFGPFPEDHVFDEKEFARLHPIKQTDIDEHSIDPDTYHGDLLQRGIALGVIREDPTAIALPTPPGPGTRPMHIAVNPGIRESVETVLRQRQQQEDMRKQEAKDREEALTEDPAGEESAPTKPRKTSKSASKSAWDEDAPIPGTVANATSVEPPQNP